MEKDSRRARGQWRGCYAFDNIIYDGDGSSSPSRKGGLKMGNTYWYYVSFYLVLDMNFSLTRNLTVQGRRWYWDSRLFSTFYDSLPPTTWAASESSLGTRWRSPSERSKCLNGITYRTLHDHEPCCEIWDTKATASHPKTSTPKHYYWIRALRKETTKPVWVTKIVSFALVTENLLWSQDSYELESFSRERLEQEGRGCAH